MTEIIFRCDASKIIGSGHVIRCRTLARKLIKYNVEVVFICRPQPGDLISLLADEFKVLILPPNNNQFSLFHQGAASRAKGRTLYSIWLGCDQEQDAAESIKLLKYENLRSIKWVIIDHYGIDWKWENYFKKNFIDLNNINTLLMAIDDLADRNHQVDCLLDQDFFGENGEHRYKNLVSDKCIQLLGPKYALLGPEYLTSRLTVQKREDIKRIFVYFGGVDATNLTSKVLNALDAPDFCNIDIDVVVGHQSPYKSELKQWSSKYSKIKLHSYIPSLADLIAKADFAIGAGGFTTWERTCLGLPCITFVIADNQLESSMSLAKYMKSPWMCITQDLSAIELREIIRKLVLGDRLMLDISSKLLGLCDGLGTNRVCEVLLAKSVDFVNKS